MVSRIDSAEGSESMTSRREMTSVESSFGGLKMSAMRRKKRLLRRGVATVSCEMTLRTGGCVRLASAESESSRARSRSTLASSSAALPAERMERRRLVVRSTFSAMRCSMLSSLSRWSESASGERRRSESRQRRTESISLP